MQAAVLSFPVRKKRPLTLALVGVVILLLVAFDLRCLASIARSLGRFGPHDAFVLWSFGRFVLTHPLGETMQGGDATYYYYPPPFAFLLAALSVLPCAPAYLLLQSADFGLYA